MNKQFEWTGRSDPEDGALAKRWHHAVRAVGPDGETPSPMAGLVGFACDLGVERNKGRVGAAAGPDAIRKALANLAWHGGDGVIGDFGTVGLAEGDGDPLERGQDDLGRRVDEALRRAGPVLVLGGGHETAAGSFNGLLRFLDGQPSRRVGIINLDAHFDLRTPGENGASSGTPFHQIHQAAQERGMDFRYLCLGVAETSNTQALFERCRDWGVGYRLDSQVRAASMEGVRRDIDEFLADCDVLYLSVDLDVLPHWQMPAVSAPAAYGVPIDVIEDIVDHLAAKKAAGDIDWPLADVVEFNPAFDADGRAARVAARLCDKILRAIL